MQSFFFMLESMNVHYLVLFCKHLFTVKWLALLLVYLKVGAPIYGGSSSMLATAVVLLFLQRDEWSVGLLEACS